MVLALRVNAQVFQPEPGTGDGESMEEKARKLMEQMSSGQAAEQPAEQGNSMEDQAKRLMEQMTSGASGGFDCSMPDVRNLYSID